MCTNPCKVIAPIRSRCLCLRVAAPTVEEVSAVLLAVAHKEGVKCPPALAERIARASDRNLRRAVLTLEACKVRSSAQAAVPAARVPRRRRPHVSHALRRSHSFSQVQQYPMVESQQIQLPDWQLYIAAVADDILREQSPKALLALRGKLYELLSNCIPPELIMKHLVGHLLKTAPGGPALKHEMLFHAASYEHRMQGGSKPIFHLEAFAAKFMAVYKKRSMAGPR